MTNDDWRMMYWEKLKCTSRYKYAVHCMNEESELSRSMGLYEAFNAGWNSRGEVEAGPNSTVKEADDDN